MKTGHLKQTNVEMTYCLAVTKTTMGNNALITPFNTSFKVKNFEHNRFDFSRIYVDKALPVNLGELLQLAQLRHQLRKHDGCTAVAVVRFKIMLE